MRELTSLSIWAMVPWTLSWNDILQDVCCEGFLRIVEMYAAFASANFEELIVICVVGQLLRKENGWAKCVPLF